MDVKLYILVEGLRYARFNIFMIAFCHGLKQKASTVRTLVQPLKQEYVAFRIFRALSLLDLKSLLRVYLIKAIRTRAERADRRKVVHTWAHFYISLW